MLEPGFYNMDCMPGMADFPDKHFDIAIVDPPYGIGESGSRNKSRGSLARATEYKAFYGNDAAAPDESYFRELFRVSKNQVIFGANHFISKIPYNASCWLVWDKENGDNDFADCELAWTSFKCAVRIFRFRWAGMMQGDMKNKEVRIHPTQKPVRLYSWILSKFAKQGDIILDTHVGSASSLIACHRAGLQYVGFEIDPHYYQLANARLEEEKAQVSVFDLLAGGLIIISDTNFFFFRPTMSRFLTQRDNGKPGSAAKAVSSLYSDAERRAA